MSFIIAFVILAAVVGGCDITPGVKLLVISAAVAALWSSRLRKRHSAASVVGTNGVNPPTLFNTTFWVVFASAVFLPPLIPLLVVVALFIRTTP